MAPAYKPPTIEEKEAYVREIFNQIAENYDEMNQVMSAGQWARWHKAFLAQCDFRPGDKILDVACGTGDLSMLDASLVAGDGGHVTGVDISEGMMEVGRRRIASTPWKDMINLELGNAMDLHFEADTFDGATMGWAMRNVPGIPQTLSEIHRVLKPGARFVCLEAARPYSRLVELGFFVYWKTFLPLIDKLVLKTKKDAKHRPYTYLSRSLDNYPRPHELEKLFKAAGFRETGWTPLMMGTVAIHWGVK